jgi:hypothetical protein
MRCRKALGGDGGAFDLRFVMVLLRTGQQPAAQVGGIARDFAADWLINVPPCNARYAIGKPRPGLGRHAGPLLREGRSSDGDSSPVMGIAAAGKARHQDQPAIFTIRRLSLTMQARPTPGRKSISRARMDRIRSDTSERGRCEADTGGGRSQQPADHADRRGLHWNARGFHRHGCDGERQPQQLTYGGN